MMRVSLLTRAVLLATAAMFAAHGIALGHTSGTGATSEHVLLEVAEWGLGLAILLGVVVLAFWIRAKRRPE